MGDRKESSRSSTHKSSHDKAKVRSSFSMHIISHRKGDPSSTGGQALRSGGTGEPSSAGGEEPYYMVSRLDRDPSEMPSHRRLDPSSTQGHASLPERYSEWFSFRGLVPHYMGSRMDRNPSRGPSLQWMIDFSGRSEKDIQGYNRDPRGPGFPSDQIRAPEPSSLWTEQDRSMASRQSQRDTLPKKEQKKQDAWAQKQFKIALAGQCPDRFTWQRVENGYWCQGKTHYVTDELVAEGNGGFYKAFPEFSRDARLRSKVKTFWRGPFYDPPTYFDPSYENKLSKSQLPKELRNKNVCKELVV